MDIGDELGKLSDLHQRGVLSDEEFARAKQRVIEGQPAGPRAATAAVNGFRRSLQDRWLGGVCGGIAQLTGVASWVWRLAFVMMMVCAGTGLVAYLLLWIFVPLEETYGTPKMPLPAR